MLRILAPALLASAALAQNYYSAALEGAQEVPPVAGNARGWGIVRHDTAANSVRIFVFHDGLTGAPIAAHLHLGAAGVNGGIIVTLTATGPNVFTGTGTLSPAQGTALSTAGTYLNVHTGANPGGEIRGQVVPSVSTRFTGVLAGAQQVPPVASAASGTAIAYLHEPENRIVYMVSSSGLANVVAAHFHQGAIATNGPVIIDFGSGNGNYCGVSSPLTAAQVASWKANGFYANIHTAANPGGEIRAQMIRDAGDHFAAALNAASEVPPNASPALGGVSVILGPNGNVNLQGQFTGLTGPPTAAHVHVAATGVNGPIVFPLVIGAGTLSANYTPTPADLVNLRAGNWYVNVHTAANPGGEIRGQLDPARLPATFGQGCPGSNGVRPQIGARRLPVVGTQMFVDLYGTLPGAFTIFAFGASRDSIGGVIPLPQELTALGLAAPRCFLLVDPAILLGVVADPFGCAELSIAIPFDPVLRGQTFFAQWFPLDPAANPGLFVASSALTLALQ
jgi:hypothetical protein